MKTCGKGDTNPATIIVNQIFNDDDDDEALTKIVPVNNKIKETHSKIYGDASSISSSASKDKGKESQSSSSPSSPSTTRITTNSIIGGAVVSGIRTPPLTILSTLTKAQKYDSEHSNRSSPDRNSNIDYSRNNSDIELGNNSGDADNENDDSSSSSSRSEDISHDDSTTVRHLYKAVAHERAMFEAAFVRCMTDPMYNNNYKSTDKQGYYNNRRRTYPGNYGHTKSNDWGRKSMAVTGTITEIDTSSSSSNNSSYPSIDEIHDAPVPAFSVTTPSRHQRRSKALGIASPLENFGIWKEKKRSSNKSSSTIDDAVTTTKPRRIDFRLSLLQRKKNWRTRCKSNKNDTMDDDDDDVILCKSAIASTTVTNDKNNNRSSKKKPCCCVFIITTILILMSMLLIGKYTGKIIQVQSLFIGKYIPSFSNKNSIPGGSGPQNHPSPNSVVVASENIIINNAGQQ